MAAAAPLVFNTYGHLRSIQNHSEMQVDRTHTRSNGSCRQTLQCIWTTQQHGEPEQRPVFLRQPPQYAAPSLERVMDGEVVYSCATGDPGRMWNMEQAMQLCWARQANKRWHLSSQADTSTDIFSTEADAITNGLEGLSAVCAVICNTSSVKLATPTTTPR